MITRRTLLGAGAVAAVSPASLLVPAIAPAKAVPPLEYGEIVNPAYLEVVYSNGTTYFLPVFTH